MFGLTLHSRNESAVPDAARCLGDAGLLGTREVADAFVDELNVLRAWEDNSICANFGHLTVQFDRRTGALVAAKAYYRLVGKPAPDDPLSKPQRPLHDGKPAPDDPSESFPFTHPPRTTRDAPSHGRRRTNRRGLALDFELVVKREAAEKMNGSDALRTAGWPTHADPGGVTAGGFLKFALAPGARRNRALAHVEIESPSDGPAAHRAIASDAAAAQTQ